MKTKLLLLALILSLFLNSFTSIAQTMPFPQNKVYSYGLMPSNRSAADAQSAYNTWKANFLTACSNGRYRVKFDDQSQTVSEGIAYGMLLTAYAGERPLFDGLWNYYKDFRNSHGVMHWKTGSCSGIIGQNGATDAEVDAAMALIVAHYQWGSTGSINYSSDAKTLIAAIKAWEVESGSNVLKPGDMFGGSNLTNPSYFSPGYFRAYAAFTGDNFWNGVADKCYDVINKNLSVNGAAGGLVSDWCNGDGTYSSSASGYFNGGRRYHYDAARTPWRIATDYVWYGNANGKSYSLKSSNFVRVNLGGPQNVKDGYYQNGTAYGQWHNSTFAGAFACAAMGGDNATHLNNSYTDLRNINDNNSYFNHTLKTLYLFLLTGNFYNPTSGSNPNPVNVAPSVSLSSPANNASFTAPATISITANASDSDGSVSKVEFYSGSTKLGEDLSSPYSFTWSNVAAGSYSLTARATDNAGATTTSSTVAITVNGSTPVNRAPLVSITGPANNASFTAPATITISANASDPDGSIRRVEFYSGSTKLGEDLSSPYSFTWSNVAAGSYSLTARATDNAGATTTSSTVAITVNGSTPVNRAPVVSITGPANNASFTAPATITISANASDPDGSISRVEFYSGSTKLGEDLSSPYSFTWSGVAAGSYTLSARATDNAGAATTSAIVNVTVTSSNTSNCPVNAVPAASHWVVRNDWSDQNNGSVVSNTTDALQITHRQWGRNSLWVVETGKTLSVTAGVSYKITFEFRNDASNPVSSVGVGFAKSLSWSGAALEQPAVTVTGFSSSAFTSKTITLTSTYTGAVNLAFLLTWPGQPNLQVNTFLKNISACTATAARFAATPAVQGASYEANPNPFDSESVIHVKDALSVSMKVTVSDASGIVREELTGMTNEPLIIGNSLPAGVYFVQAVYEGKQMIFKIVKN